MKAVSQAFNRAMLNNATLLVKATIKYSDGATQNLGGDDICAMSVEASSSSSGSFDIGAAIVGQLSVTLNNYDERFSARDFEKSVIVPYVGKDVGGGDIEWLCLGTYVTSQPDSYSGQISITALDYLSKLEKDYDSSKVSWPCTLGLLAKAACDACGVELRSSGFANSEYSIVSEPELESETWLDIIGYIAQMSGTFARAGADGSIEFAWYDTTSLESEDWLDGETFDNASPYASGDSANGGDFINYSAGSTYDGGTFAFNHDVANINRFSSLSVYTDDVVITGIQVAAANEVVIDDDGNESNGNDGETALYGSDGYVLSIDSNPLVLYGQAATIASQVGKRVVGMRFRPFSCSAVADPSIEPGDAAIVTDRKDNAYHTYVTSTNLTVNGSETIECTAKSASRNSASSASAATKAIVAARNDVKREQTGREAALAKMKEMLEGEIASNGLFSTTVKQSDGSSIYYLHNKSDLQSSGIVWKMTANAVAVSTNGPDGPYATGLTADGTAILDRIYAIGIDASYISSGTYLVKDANGDVTAKIVSSSSDSGIYCLDPFTNKMEQLSWSAFRKPTIIAMASSTKATASVYKKFTADATGFSATATATQKTSSGKGVTIPVEPGRGLMVYAIGKSGGSIALTTTAKGEQSASSINSVVASASLASVAYPIVDTASFTGTYAVANGSANSSASALGTHVSDVTDSPASVGRSLTTFGPMFLLAKYNQTEMTISGLAIKATVTADVAITENATAVVDGGGALELTRLICVPY